MENGEWRIPPSGSVQPMENGLAFLFIFLISLPIVPFFTNSKL